jgi:monoamine oxidase
MDAAVIGGGIAGLATALELAAKGLDFKLIEASGRLGGRIWTVEAGGLPLELGAEFIHGKPKALYELAKKAGCDPQLITGTPWLARNGVFESCAAFFEQVDKVIAKMDRPSLKEHDESFDEFAATLHGVSAEQKRWAREYVEGFHASHAERVSVRALVEGEKASETIEGEKQFRLLGGYSRMIDYLAAQLPAESICLNTAVRAVRWRKGAATLESSAGEMKARAVIVTVPLSVLQAATGAGAIRFEPELPAAKKIALTQMEMGPVVRISFLFKRPFWRELHGELDDLSFLFSHAHHFPTWWTRQPSTAPVLTGWASGPRAEKLSGLSEEAMVNRAIESLAKMLGASEAKIRDELVTWRTHDWQSDPYFRGAYSWVKKDGGNAEWVLAMPVADTLFFAGEATNYEGHSGTVNGAYDTGIRAASEVVAALQK